MIGERTHPILTVPGLDEAISFYAALGFRVTYRQVRPNPYAVVELEDIVVHLAAVAGFDPASSYGSVIIVVPDAEALYAGFAAGLRRAYGRLPSAGIPRILRPRRKQGTATGFSVVDVGGNWLRIYAAGETEDQSANPSTGLARAVEVAARQADARGDDQAALDVLDRALARPGDALGEDRARALLYRAELLVRLDRHDEAAAVVRQVRGGLTPDETARLATDLAHAEEVLGP